MQDGPVDAEPAVVTVDLDDTAVAGAVPARHRSFPGELRTRNPCPEGFEHRFGTAGENVPGIGRNQLGDETRFNDDLGSRKETGGLGMALGAKAQNDGRMTQRRREVRHRRDSDAACDEKRPVNVQIEAVSERAENVNRVAGRERAERARARAYRVDQKRELTGRRLA